MDSSLSAPDIAALVSALLLGLSAGLFFAFSVAVMPGLRRVDDGAFVGTMNAVNRAILNPLFLVVFVGALLAPAVGAVLSFAAAEPPRAWLLVGATAVYLVGVILVTGGVNVPLNNALAANDDRAAFEARWVRFTSLRTAAAFIAFAVATVALLL